MTRFLPHRTAALVGLVSLVAMAASSGSALAQGEGVGRLTDESYAAEGIQDGGSLADMLRNALSDLAIAPETMVLTPTREGDAIPRYAVVLQEGDADTGPITGVTVVGGTITLQAGSDRVPGVLLRSLGNEVYLMLACKADGCPLQKQVEAALESLPEGELDAAAATLAEAPAAPVATPGLELLVLPRTDGTGRGAYWARLTPSCESREGTPVAVPFDEPITLPAPPGAGEDACLYLASSSEQLNERTFCKDVRLGRGVQYTARELDTLLFAPSLRCDPPRPATARARIVERDARGNDVTDRSPTGLRLAYDGAQVRGSIELPEGRPPPPSGFSLDGYTIEAATVDGEGDDREVVVTVRRGFVLARDYLMYPTDGRSLYRECEAYLVVPSGARVGDIGLRTTEGDSILPFRLRRADDGQGVGGELVGYGVDSDVGIRIDADPPARVEFRGDCRSDGEKNRLLTHERLLTERDEFQAVAAPRRLLVLAVNDGREDFLARRGLSFFFWEVALGATVEITGSGPSSNYDRVALTAWKDSTVDVLKTWSGDIAAPNTDEISRFTVQLDQQEPPERFTSFTIGKAIDALQDFGTQYTVGDIVVLGPALRGEDPCAGLIRELAQPGPFVTGGTRLVAVTATEDESTDVSDVTPEDLVQVCELGGDWAEVALVVEVKPTALQVPGYRRMAQDEIVSLATAFFARERAAQE